ncbi:MAG: alcohol dehydrogenase catalytic domain-containing protein [Pseudomonadota bacterium]
MRALVFTATEALELREIEPPAPAPGQAVVRISQCGICGSDMHAWHGQDSRRVPPLVLGHEAVGVVETGPLSGRRVAINPLMTCGSCPVCNTGREHLCPTRELIGMRVPGAFAEHVAIAEANLTPLPDHLDFAHAVVAEPLAVAVHAVGLAPSIAAGMARSVTVLGGGAVGMLAAMVLRHRGVEHLVVAETNAGRRAALDRLLGAGTAYDPLAETPIAEGRSDVVIDAVGSGPTRAAASALVAPGGTIVHLGLQDNAPGLDTRRLTLQEITLVGVYCYTRADFAAGLDLLASRAITTDGWAQTRPLADGARAFEDIDAGRAPAKLVLAME